ncbi:glycosyltransferase family 4 protein [Acidomyces richmondensis BFW]|nr:MAG: glycosyltransferase family 4 protein [Acidomyces sp. 'richmondensis']KYG42004.1 glycosyltransferase family 4 protein [Acidomyces richmondensis BFW]
MAIDRSHHIPGRLAPAVPRPEFPQQLIGVKLLLASESLGPVNGVSRTTQSLIDYLRSNGVQVATCAPQYAGQHILDPKPDRQPFVNPDWVRQIEAKSSSLASRGIGGSWMFHNSQRDDASGGEGQALQHGPASSRHTPILNRRRSGDAQKKAEGGGVRSAHPEFRLRGYPLPYNPDLTVAYPFRLGVVYDKTFVPDIIYLASPASVGFQFLVQLRCLDQPPPVFLNFQTDLSAYAEILFPAPLDRYAVWLLQVVQGYLFHAPSVRTIFYPSAYVRKYMEAVGAPAHKMRQLGRGVDTDLFNPGRRDEKRRLELAPNGELIFACICRVAPEKGFEFLARATKKLAETGLKFKLLIVGSNKNPAVVREVEDYFAEVRDLVCFAGMKRGVALAREYASADVFLHCSVTETFGLVVLESMASGVPVIARDEGGPSETVQHGTSGFLVPPHDLDGFVQKAYDIAVDATLRQVMSNHAREQALNTTWDKINNQVALELAAALHDRLPKSDEQKRLDGFYGSWVNMVRVYLAVGIVWVFWLIAVIPMLACGRVHGMFRKR